jgi:hypothetical protein
MERSSVIRCTQLKKVVRCTRCRWPLYTVRGWFSEPSSKEEKGVGGFGNKLPSKFQSGGARAPSPTPAPKKRGRPRKHLALLLGNDLHSLRSLSCINLLLIPLNNLQEMNRTAPSFSNKLILNSATWAKSSMSSAYTGGFISLPIANIERQVSRLSLLSPSGSRWQC